MLANAGGDLANIGVTAVNEFGAAFHNTVLAAINDGNSAFQAVAAGLAAAIARLTVGGSITVGGGVDVGGGVSTASAKSVESFTPAAVTSTKVPDAGSTVTLSTMDAAEAPATKASPKFNALKGFPAKPETAAPTTDPTTASGPLQRDPEAGRRGDARASRTRWIRQ